MVSQDKHSFLSYALFFSISSITPLLHTSWLISKRGRSIWAYTLMFCHHQKGGDCWLQGPQCSNNDFDDTKNCVILICLLSAFLGNWCKASIWELLMKIMEVMDKCMEFVRDAKALKLLKFLSMMVKNVHELWWVLMYLDRFKCYPKKTLGLRASLSLCVSIAYVDRFKCEPNENTWEKVRAWSLEP